MIQLYDHFHQSSQDLYHSLKEAGFNGPAVVINDDGFLPEGVTSAYSYFCQMETGNGRPLYFNQIAVPEFWEITASNADGEVWDYSYRRAKIFYAEPKHLRLVKNVDWFDKQEKVRFTDHYNQYGWLYARTYFTADQKGATRTYFNQAKQEVLVENFMTGDIILNWQGKTHFFDSRVELFLYYFEEMGWDSSQIWYNSLSTPFFLSYGMNQPGKDILFWQENIGDEIPGNMRALLNNPHARTQRIIVQNYDVYIKMMDLVDETHKSKLTYLGYIYPNIRNNQNRKDILIVTNSDQVEQLEYLVDQLIDFDFHIAALTEMSQRLQVFDKKDNVNLYPNASASNLDKLFKDCDIYFDINHGGQVLSAVRRAFENNMLIYGFQQTAHEPKLVLKDHLYSTAEANLLVQSLISLNGQFEPTVQKQRLGTSHESIQRYQGILS
ncbi:TPA: accessory Sec system glycosylation chaperone GtfB [Streptococcus suis]